MPPPRRIKKSGVYRLVCAKTGYTYHGSSLDLVKRERYYWSRLERGGCHNKALQYAFDAFGRDNLRFEVVEECDADVLRERELHYIRTFDGKSFNILRDSRNVGPVSEETRRKLSERAKEQHAQGRLGRQTWSNT